MLVYTKMGGGHYSLAQTLHRVIKELDPEAEVELFNFFDSGPRWIAQAFEDGYNFSVQKQRWIFTVFASFASNRPAINAWARVLGTRLAPRVNKHLEQAHPDKLVYCYPVNHGFKRLSYVRKNKPKTLTIVSDFYSPHVYWFVDTKDQYVIASVEAYNIARRYGVRSENLHFFQNLIDPKYAEPMAPEALDRFNRELDLPYRFTVLVTGGGPGLKITKKLVNELIQVPEINILVVCGYNQRLYKQLEALKKAHNLHQLKLFGFTKQMYELINASDVVVTKAGPATISEVLSQHKDLIVCDYIWPQEAGNVEMIQRENLGSFIRKPHQIAEKVQELKSQRRERKTLSTTNDVVRLAKYILDM